MNRKELKEAMDSHTPVYYINDENYDYDCDSTEYEVAEADVHKVYVPQQEIDETETYLPFEISFGDKNTFKYFVDNNDIFSDPEKADKEAVRRFKRYVKNLRRQVKKAEEALAECERRLEEIRHYS